MHIRFLILLPCLFFITNIGKSQNLTFSQGNSSVVAETGTANQDAFSVLNNPASMSLNHTTIGVAAKQYYLVEGLNHFNLSSSFVTSIGAIGGSINYFGDNLYNEMVGTIGVSRQLTPKIRGGASILYAQSKAENIDAGTAIYPQIGILAEMSEQFQFGATIRNPFSQDMDEPYDQNNLQAVISFGGKYKPDEKFTTSFQGDITEGDGFSSGLGVEYEALDRFSFSLGGRLNPGYVTAGVNILLNKIDVTLGSQYQDQLGFSPTFAAQTEFE